MGEPWALNVLMDCLCLQPGESLLIVVDEALAAAGDALAAAAAEAKAGTVEKVVLRRLTALPANMAPDAAITLLSTVPPFGAAAASLHPGPQGRWLYGAEIDQSILACELMADYREIAARTEALAAQVQGRRHVRIRSAAGTELTFRLDGRPVFCDGGVVDKPGRVGNLPAGEVFVAPLEDSAEGRLVVDLTITGRVLDKPAELTFSKGRVVACPPELGLIGMHIGEFGIGTNPVARITGRAITDEKVAGTIHIGLGHNLDWGGCNAEPAHVDCVIRSPSVWIDNERLL